MSEASEHNHGAIRDLLAQRDAAIARATKAEGLAALGQAYIEVKRGEAEAAFAIYAGESPATQRLTRDALEHARAELKARYDALAEAAS